MYYDFIDNIAFDQSTTFSHISAAISQKTFLILKSSIFLGLLVISEKVISRNRVFWRRAKCTNIPKIIENLKNNIRKFHYSFEFSSYPYKQRNMILKGKKIQKSQSVFLCTLLRFDTYPFYCYFRDISIHHQEMFSIVFCTLVSAGLIFCSIYYLIVFSTH